MLKVLLIVVQGKPEGKTIPLAGPIFRIGRGEDCHLRPNSPEVSRHHTEIAIGDDAVTVRDLGSRNGTRVNGKLLTGSHTLKTGELLQVGPLTFAVSIQGAPAAKSASAPVPAGAGKPASLDEVPPDQIDSWLVADHANPTPDRPSGVYGGDTITIAAYKGGAAKPPSGTTPTPTPAPKPAPAPAAKSTPAPTPAAKPPTPPAPPKPAVPEVAAVTPTPAPAPVAAPTPAVTHKATAASPSARPEAQYSSPFDDIEFEQLEEGQGDVEPGGDEAGAAEEATAAIPEELVDESNPFYAARKPKPEAPAPPTPAKAAAKDSSDAASEILRKMMDRRRPPR